MAGLRLQPLGADLQVLLSVVRLHGFDRPSAFIRKRHEQNKCLPEIRTPVLSRLASFSRRNPVTPLLVVGMGLVLLAELYTLSYSESLFQHLFVAQGKFTPGLLLAPLSHATFYTHYTPNMILFLWLGWSVEARLDTRQFLGFVGATAYLPTYLQVLYSVLTSGTAGSLGFSGAVYAVPPLLFCLTLQEDNAEKIGFGEIGNIALMFSVAIPLVMFGFLDFFSGLPGAVITHSVGYIGGFGYGLHKINFPSTGMLQS